jgi:GrpB-like predicted nucleotidyltransferase (UPF0157 family)
MKTITVVKYDPAWPILFEKLRDRISNVIGDSAVAIEHVGSTAIPGLSAKPVIDISVVVKSSPDVATAIERLESLGYKHLGNQGIEGREAFDNSPHSPAHHLYVCQQGNLGLRNHLVIRDYLRSDSEAATVYAELKQKLAREYVNDIDGYTEGKTGFLMNILSACGMTPAELELIAQANRRD